MRKISKKKIAEMDDLVVKRYANVRMKDDLRIYKYSKKAFWKQLWNQWPLLTEMRGLVVDSDNNIVSYPMEKVFNYGENGAGVGREDESVIATEKVNGFLGVVSRYKGELVFSSSGSLESEYVDIVRYWLDKPVLHNVFDFLKKHFSKSGEGFTMMFEICDPSDPHIVKEKHGAHLICIRRNVDGGDHLPEMILDEVFSTFLMDDADFHRPLWKEDKLQNILDESKDMTESEGYMCKFNDRTYVKVKSAFYLTSKFLSRTKKDLSWVWEEENYRQNFDEEFYDIMDQMKESFSCFADWDAQTEEEKMEWVQNVFRAKP